NYQAISDTNDVSTQPIMLYDNNEMTFVLWRSNNVSTFKSSFYYKIMFNNGTLTDTMTIAEFSYGSPYTMMSSVTHVACIDHLNRLNFLYYNGTTANFNHVRYEDHSWVKISEVDIPYHAVCLMNDEVNKLRLIYKMRVDDVDNLYEKLFNGQTWSEEYQITPHQKSADTTIIFAYATDYAAGKEGEIAIVLTYSEFFTNGSYKEEIHCLHRKNSWQHDIIVENGMLPGPTCEFDEAGTLHVGYLSDSKAYEMYHLTYRSSWSEAKKLSVSWPKKFGNIDLSICGTSIFLLNPSDIYTDDVLTGETSVYSIGNDTIAELDFVYSSTETVPVEDSAVLAIPNGNLYVLTSEFDQEAPSTYTLFFGYKTDFFTYQEPSVFEIHWYFFGAFLIVMPMLIFCKKRRKN
ncbi:MAG: hypothetical protein ACTSPK_10920, partial [Candidatus Heimdallarchaeota archaeon]